MKKRLSEKELRNQLAEQREKIDKLCAPFDASSGAGLGVGIEAEERQKFYIEQQKWKAECLIKELNSLLLAKIKWFSAFIAAILALATFLEPIVLSFFHKL